MLSQQLLDGLDAVVSKPRVLGWRVMKEEASEAAGEVVPEAGAAVPWAEAVERRLRLRSRASPGSAPAFARSRRSSPNGKACQAKGGSA